MNAPAISRDSLRPASSEFPAALELVKWAAFVAMLIDHADLILFDRSVPWMREVGRFAMPAFALAFGYGLAHSREPFSVASRLLIPGLIAALIWGLASSLGGYPVQPFNVLLMFALCALAAESHRTFGLWSLPVFVFLGWASPHVEGEVLALLLVAGAYDHARTGRFLALGGAAVLWCGFHPYAGSVIALASFLAALAATMRVRRWPGALAWAYPLHLAALVGIAAYLT